MQALRWSFFDWGLWAALSPLSFRAARRWPFVRGNRLANFLRHLGFGLVLSSVHFVVYLVSLAVFQPVPEEARNLVALAEIVFLAKFHLEVATYWVLVLLRTTFDYYRRYREQELRATRMQAQLAQAELQALRMQLHPHFLFNTLNGVSALMHRDPDAAEQMLARLSDLLRITLETSGAQEVPLRQELDLLQRYLDIEQTRFADRLEVEMRIDPDTLDAHVPNLILQPLVENAIRHGIAPHSSAGTIELAARAENGVLHLTVRDDGPGAPAAGGAPFREGVGLSNTRERLRQLYGERSRLELGHGAEGGFEVSLDIPFRTEAADAAGREEAQT